MSLFRFCHWAMLCYHLKWNTEQQTWQQHIGFKYIQTSDVNKLYKWNGLQEAFHKCPQNKPQLRNSGFPNHVHDQIWITTAHLLHSKDLSLKKNFEKSERRNVEGKKGINTICPQFVWGTYMNTIQALSLTVLET